MRRSVLHCQEPLPPSLTTAVAANPVPCIVLPLRHAPQAALKPLSERLLRPTRRLAPAQGRGQRRAERLLLPLLPRLPRLLLSRRRSLPLAISGSRLCLTLLGRCPSCCWA